MNAVRRRLPCLAALLLALPAVAQPPAPGAGGAPAPTRESTISASGTARVERAPDYVDVMLGRVSYAPTAAAAHADASRIMSDAVTALRALKLEGEDLQTGTVDLSPRYERRDYNRDEEVPKIVGYAASITLRIRTKDLTAVPRIIDAALTAGCNKVDYVQFGIKEAIAAREEAVRLATQAARRKALVIAESLDLRITRVVDAGTTSHQGGFWYGNNRMSQMSNVSNESSGAGGEGESPVVPGKIEVWADATITFGAEANR